MLQLKINAIIVVIPVSAYNLINVLIAVLLQIGHLIKINATVIVNLETIVLNRFVFNVIIHA